MPLYVEVLSKLHELAGDAGALCLQVRDTAFRNLQSPYTLAQSVTNLPCLVPSFRQGALEELDGVFAFSNGSRLVANTVVLPDSSVIGLLCPGKVLFKTRDTGSADTQLLRWSAEVHLMGSYGFQAILVASKSLQLLLAVRRLVVRLSLHTDHLQAE